MQISQSLERGLNVLEAIDRSPTPLGVREIGRQLDLSATIVQRLVNTLTAGGFIEQVPESRRYKIGYRSVSLGMSSRHDDSLVRTSHSRLVRLAEQHGLNGFVGVLTGGRAVYVLCVPSRHRILLRVDAGETITLHTTALGRILLAAVGDNGAASLLGQGPLEQITPKSITAPAAIIGQLPEIRRTGYASVGEENITGIVSIGAPIRNANGDIIAGMSVAYAIGTLALSFSDIVNITITTAAEISRELGCPESLMLHWGIDQ